MLIYVFSVLALFVMLIMFLIDCIKAMMFVWRLRRKIIGTVQCCCVRQLCTMMLTHVCSSYSCICLFGFRFVFVF